MTTQPLFARTQRDAARASAKPVRPRTGSSRSTSFIRYHKAAGTARNVTTLETNDSRC